MKDCGDVERLDAQSGSDTDSSSDNGSLLEETKQGFFSTLIHTGFCEHLLIPQVVGLDQICFFLYPFCFLLYLFCFSSSHVELINGVQYLQRSTALWLQVKLECS